MSIQLDKSFSLPNMSVSPGLGLLPLPSLPKKENTPTSPSKTTRVSPVKPLPAIVPVKRTYLKIKKSPAVVIEARLTHNEQFLEELKDRLEKLDLNHLPIVPTLEKTATSTFLKFPKGSRGYLYLLPWLFPKLSHYLRSMDYTSCIRYAGERVPSVYGLIETEQSVAAFNTRVTRLVTDAQQYLRQSRQITPVSCQLLPANPIKQIFTKFDGLCVGEEHDGVNPKKFLIEKMPLFKKNGVRTLFIETLSYELQAHLDEYFSSPNFELPPLLREALRVKDEGCRLSGPYTYTNLVRKAKEEGIRIVGLDTDLAYEAGGTLSTYEQTLERVQALNYLAEKIIRYEKGKGKYVVFVGSLHGTSVNTENGRILGLADLLQIPLMIANDKAGKPSLKMNISGADTGNPYLVDFAHIHIYSEKPIPTTHS